MPLPNNGTPWPPKELERITPHLRAWDAWLVGDPARLAEHYSGYMFAGGPGYPARAAQYRGGIVGTVARWFWGQPPSGEVPTRLHVPIAADVCKAASDLLYSERPTFTVEDETTQTRLNDLLDDALFGVLAEAAEIGAALGGSYLRVNWDKAVVPDKPFLTCVYADAALPTFRYGRLTSVLFWTVVHRVDNQVWRLLESHELNEAGEGVIQYGLYQGSDGDLGNLVPFTDLRATAGFAAWDLVDGNTITTGSPGLAVVYIPTARPQRRWRNDPIGYSLGRSILDGIEHLMDALDETYSSWMRDVRIGKARIFVDRSMLEDHGPGKGASVDLDREVFAPLNMPNAPSSLNPAQQANGGKLLQAEQFLIRHAEHGATADALMREILRSAGFSPQTFGLDDGTADASQMTATEVKAKERQSYMTRDRMLQLARPELQAIVEKMLAVDASMFASGVTPQRPTVEFADAVQESPLQLAQTAQAMAAADAASIGVRVRTLHPDWDDEQVEAEVAAIQDEKQAAAQLVPDLGQMPGDQQGSAGQPPEQ